MTDLTQAEINDLVRSKLPESVRNQQWVIDKATAQLINQYGLENVISTLQYQQGFQYTKIGFYSHPNADIPTPEVSIGGEIKAGMEIDFLNGIHFLGETEASMKLGNVGFSLNSNGVTSTYMVISKGSADANVGMSTDGTKFAELSLDAGKIAGNIRIEAGSSEGFWQTSIANELTFGASLYGVMLFPAIAITKVTDSRTLISANFDNIIKSGYLDAEEEAQSWGIYNNFHDKFSAVNITADDFIRNVRFEAEIQGLTVWQANAKILKDMIGSSSDGFDPLSVTTPNQLGYYIQDRLVQLGGSYVGNPDLGNYEIGGAIESIDFSLNEAEVADSLGLSLAELSVDGKITVSKPVNIWVKEGSGDYTQVTVDPAAAKVEAFDTRYSAAVANGTVISNTTSLINMYGATFSKHDVVISYNGKQYTSTEFTASLGSNPSNGVTHQVFVQESLNGQLLSTKEYTTFKDSAGITHNTEEFREGEDGNWHVTESLTVNGQTIKGDTYIVPSSEMLVAFQAVGGTVGSFLGAKLADGSVYKDIVYSTFLKSVGEHFGTFSAYLATNPDLQKALNAAMGASSVGTIFQNAEFSETFFKNLNGKVSSVLGTLIVDKVGNALDIDGVLGEAIIAAGNAVTTQFIGETIDVVLTNLDSTVFKGISDGLFFKQPVYENGQLVYENGSIKYQTISIENLVVSAIATYAAGRLAGEIISPESQQAAIFGSIGSTIGGIIATNTGYFANSIVATTVGNSLSTIFGAAGSFAPIVGTAIGAFIGQIAGTLLGNIFGSDDTPSSWAKIRFDKVTHDYVVNESWGNNGGNVQIAQDMSTAVVNAVNSILDLTGGTIRSTAIVPSYQIGMDGDKFVIYKNQGQATKFDQSGEAINDAVFNILKNSDVVGGDALLMRAWHNSDATNLYDFKEDLEVAEAFQNYLMDPTAIIAFMLDKPDSDLAQSWAAVLKRAAELELHLPHEKDFDGSWNELLLARGDLDPSLIPEIDGDNIVLVDPETGKETIIHHVIGPGYQIIHMTGTDGNDIIEVIVDGPSIGYVDAGAGNDVIVGSPERDIIVGGAGDDEIDGKSGDDWLHGASGNDTVYGNNGNDLVVGGADNDILTDGAGNDTLYGGKGNDKLTSGLGSDSLYGGEGNDELHGSTSSEEDYLYGQEGNDSIFAYGHHNHLVGGQGNDTLKIISGTHTIKINRGDGHDTVILADTPSAFHLIDFGLTISPNELWFQRTGENLVIKVVGENQSVTIKDWFAGTVANRPSVTIRVQDLQFEYNGNKDIKSFAQTLVNFYAAFPQPSGEFNILDNVTLAQVNSLPYLKSLSSNVVVNPSMPSSNVTEYFYGDASGNSITVNGGSDRAAGGAGNDTIIGGTVDNSNTFFGDSGNDTIKGGHGRDLLFGGLGDDILWGESDDDNLSGNFGNDTLLGSDGNDILSGGEGNDILDGGNGNDTIRGGNGDDIITDASGVNMVYGDAGNDNITIGTGNDTVYAGSGNDNVTAGAGNDLLLGEDGNDYIEGNDGDDTISGGSGDDTLLGGLGSDRIEGNLGNDVIVHSVTASATTTDNYFGGEGVDILELRISATDFANTTINSAIKTLAHDIRNTLNNASTLTYQTVTLGLSINSIETLKVYVDGSLVEISPNNSRPVANDDTFFLEENRVVLVNPLLNDQDPQGDVFTLKAVSTALYGTVTVNQDNTITYKPNSSTFYGVDYFTYSIQDAYGEKGYGYVSMYFIQPSGNILGTEVNNMISGTASNDSIFAKEGNDTVNAAAGDDSIYGMAGNDTLNGGLGNDLLDGGEGNDILSGGDGNDKLSGGAGNDDLKGEVGNDILYLSYGSDILNGGDGTDILNASRLVEGTNINLSTGVVLASLLDVTQLSNIENIIAGQFNDILVGSSLGNNIQGGAGNDEIRGLGGDDTLYGDAGNDVLYGGDGNDYLYGNDGDDLFYSDNGSDQLFGGAGWDKIYFTGNGVSVDLRLTTGFSDGHGSTDKISTDFEEVYGSSKGDVIRGQDGVNNILRGEAGNDIVDGNGGDDLIEGGAGNDTLQGGTGIDTVTYERAASGVVLNLATGTQNDGGGGQDTLSSLENAIGSNFVDTLQGDGANNIIQGLGGNDIIKGGSGNDTIDGGNGNDTLYGEIGSDIFKLALYSGSSDTIMDFSLAQSDKLDIRNILSGYDPLTSSIANFIEMTNSGTNTVVKIDKDGAGTAYGWQQVATLNNVTGLTDEQSLVSNGTLIV